MEPKRLIFHIDVNSAFLSWEATRRVKAGEPDLRLVPSAIGGDPESRRGVILAKSIPAKRYGVKTGEPVAMALRKCPGLVLARPDFRLYIHESRAFKSICRSYAPVVEEYSIDEVFCDFTGTSYIYPDPIALAYEIKDKIRTELGFTVNVGIGNNKLCAKMAGDFEKPDKVHTLFDEEIRSKMWPLPVGDLISCGASTADKLHRFGIHTIGDLAGTELTAVQRILGHKLGILLHDYANGIDDSQVAAEPAEAKGYSNETTLEDDVTDVQTAENILLALADSVATRIRADGRLAHCIAVTIRGNDMRKHSHQRHLDRATDITSDVYEIARTLFRELWDGDMPIRLIGLAMTELDDGSFDQLDLFEGTEKREKKRDLDKAVDSIRQRFGYGSLTMGTAGQFGVGSKHRAKEENEME